MSIELEVKKEKTITVVENDKEDTTYLYSLEAVDDSDIRMAVKSSERVAILKKGSKVRISEVETQTEVNDHLPIHS